MGTKRDVRSDDNYKFLSQLAKAQLYGILVRVWKILFVKEFFNLFLVLEPG